MPRRTKNREGMTLRLWRRGGHAQRRMRSEPWPFALAKAGGGLVKVPLLWRDYAWGPVDVESSVRKRRPARVHRAGFVIRPAAGPGNFDCTALTGRMVPLCVFGIEKAAAQQNVVGTKQ